jgi:hypothetical protein
MSGFGVDLDEREQTAQREEFAYEDGDEERFAHYVRKEQIAAAAIEGIPAIALCGKLWVPVKDPSRFPVCPRCKEIYESLP